MEWMHVLSPALSENNIHKHCTLQNLPQLCSDVYEVNLTDTDGRHGEISCIWGVFQLEVYPIKNGVRYALTSCPNALQWTVTSRHGETTIHCSINQTTPDPEFAETIESFLLHFYLGLQSMPE